MLIYVASVFGVVTAIVAALGVRHCARLVPGGYTMAVYRRGQLRLLGPGWNLIFPTDQVHHVDWSWTEETEDGEQERRTYRSSLIPTTPQQLDVVPCEALDDEQIKVVINGTLHYEIEDVVAAVRGVGNLVGNLDDCVKVGTVNAMARISSADITTKRTDIENEIVGYVQQRLEGSGVKCTQYIIQGFVRMDEIESLPTEQKRLENENRLLISRENAKRQREEFESAQEIQRANAEKGKRQRIAEIRRAEELEEAKASSEDKASREAIAQAAELKKMALTLETTAKQAAMKQESELKRATLHHEAEIKRAALEHEAKNKRAALEYASKAKQAELDHASKAKQAELDHAASAKRAEAKHEQEKLAEQRKRELDEARWEHEKRRRAEELEQAKVEAEIRTLKTRSELAGESIRSELVNAEYRSLMEAGYKSEHIVALKAAPHLAAAMGKTQKMIITERGAESAGAFPMQLLMGELLPGHSLVSHLHSTAPSTTAAASSSSSSSSHK